MSDWKIIVSGSTLDLDTNYGFRVQQMLGAGMAEVDNISTGFGVLDGAIFQRTRVPEREFSLVGTLYGASSINDLHRKRSNLIDAIKPDRSASQQAVVLQYQGAACNVSASCYYMSGLTLGNVSARIEQQLSLKFIQFDPYWEATQSSSATLTTQASFAYNYVAQRAASGTWYSLGSGFNNAVRAITSTSTGALIFGGNFTTASGAGAQYIAQWNNGFSTVGASNALNDVVLTVSVGNDGYIYAGGTFTSASGTAACYVARHTGTGWTTMASGLSGNANQVWDSQVDTDGNVLFVGSFNLAGGGVNASNIARWNRSSSNWSVVGGGVNNLVYAVDQATNGDVWVGGQFSTAGSAGTTSCRVAKYSVSASDWQPVGACGIASGTNYVKGLALDNSGTAWIGIDQQSANSSCTLYSSNGTGLFAVYPTAGRIYKINHEKISNTIYVTGFSTICKGVSGPVRLVSGTPAPLDILFPSGTNIYAVHSASTGVITLGSDNGGTTACAAAVVTVTNGGTASTYPVLTACAPASASATLIQLVNYTTGDAIYFNLGLQPSEIVTLDLRPGKKTLTSNFRGNIISTIVPGSNIATWRLIPGTNNISFYLTSGSGAGKLTWTNRFWGIDN